MLVKYMMEIAIAPPSRVAAGVSLQTPLVVTFMGSSAAGDDRHDDAKELTLPDLSGIWVFLSLTTPDMEESLVPPREDLYCGKRADSVHPVYHEQEVDKPTIAYSMFPDLVIREPGSYRIKVSVIDMNAAFRGVAEENVGKVLPCLHSEVFEVVEASEHSGYEPKLEETIGRLRSIGVNC